MPAPEFTKGGRYMSLTIVKNTIPRGIDKYIEVSNEADKKGKAAAGLQLLNNIVNGSELNSIVPPVLTGLLRGSGSVFLGSKLIGVSPHVTGATPNRSHGEKNSDFVTVGYNTSYAARMHEELAPAGGLQPGPRSRQSGNVEGKFIESHLKTDGPELMQLYADIIKKETGG